MGGTITIVHGSYTRALHNRIFETHREQGNEPIDALFCVPPDAMAEYPVLSRRLQDWGFSVWDGTSRDVRDTCPTKAEEHRVVRYESCRGLEGWTVVCVALERFFVNRYNHVTSTHGESLFDTTEDFAHRQATAWTLIPLTRAIDHLVIQLQGDGVVTTICRKLAEDFPEFVTWEESK